MSLANSYAQTIINVTAHGSKADFVTKLVAFMKSRGHLSLLPQVIRIVERAPNPSQATVTVRSAHDEKKYKDAITKALKDLGIEGHHTTVEDPNLVGGFMVQGKGKVIDNSFRSALVKIYQNTIRS